MKIINIFSGTLVGMFKITLSGDFTTRIILCLLIAMAWIGINNNMSFLLWSGILGFFIYCYSKRKGVN